MAGLFDDLIAKHAGQGAAASAAQSDAPAVVAPAPAAEPKPSDVGTAPATDNVIAFPGATPPASAAPAAAAPQPQQASPSLDDVFADVKKETGVDLSTLAKTPAAPAGAAGSAMSSGAERGDWETEHATVMDRIINDPVYRNRPDLQKAMLAQEQKWAETQRANDAAQTIRAKNLQIQGDLYHSQMVTTIHRAVSDLQAGKPVDFDALQRQIESAPELALQGGKKEELFKLIDAAVKDPDNELKKYGAQFWPTLQRIWADPSSPDRITTVDQLHQVAGPGKGVTLAGLEKLETELLKPKTPAGEGTTYLLKGFVEAGHARIAPNSTREFPDQKGEDRFQTWLGHALGQYDTGLRAGKSPTELLTPDSKDYIGKDIKLYEAPVNADAYKDKPAPAHWWSGWFGSGTGAAPAAPASGAYNPDMATSLGDLQAAVRAGKITSDDARAYALHHKWVRPDPVALAPPISR